MRDANHSLFGLSNPYHLEDDYLSLPNETADLEAWPCPEPLINDETIYPLDLLESEMAAYKTPSRSLYPPCPSWRGSQVDYNTAPGQCVTANNPKRDESRDCKMTLASEITQSSPRSVGSAASDQRRLSPERISSLDADLSPSDESISQSSRGIKRKRSGASRAAAHNLIEKKYRSNLNEKMIALRDSIPSLRMAAEHADSVDGREPGRKLNKVGIHTYLHTHLPLEGRTN